MSGGKQSKERAYLWLDLETTGLDPKQHSIIELAAVLTDDKLNSLLTFHDLVTPARPIWDAFTREMHEKSGLVEALNNGPTYPIWEVLQHLMNAVGPLTAGKDVMLGGYSIHFDRGFLQEFAPKDFWKVVGHRNLDVRPIETLMKDAGVWEDTDTTEAPHRSMPDVLRALQRYRHFRDRLASATWPLPMNTP